MVIPCTCGSSENFTIHRICVWICIYLTAPQHVGWNTRSIFKQSLKSKFSFETGCLTKAKEPNLPNYLPVAGGRTDIALWHHVESCNATQYEINSVSFSIWKFISSSSSSSYRAGSTDIPDPLLPLLPIVHRPRQVFRTSTCILT